MLTIVRQTGDEYDERSRTDEWCFLGDLGTTKFAYERDNDVALDLYYMKGE